MQARIWGVCTSGARLTLSSLLACAAQINMRIESSGFRPKPDIIASYIAIANIWCHNAVDPTVVFPLRRPSKPYENLADWRGITRRSMRMIEQTDLAYTMQKYSPVILAGRSSWETKVGQTMIRTSFDSGLLAFIRFRKLHMN